MLARLKMEFWKHTSKFKGIALCQKSINWNWDDFPCQLMDALFRTEWCIPFSKSFSMNYPLTVRICIQLFCSLHISLLKMKSFIGIFLFIGRRLISISLSFQCVDFLIWRQVVKYTSEDVMLFNQHLAFGQGIEHFSSYIGSNK